MSKNSIVQRKDIRVGKVVYCVSEDTKVVRMMITKVRHMGYGIFVHGIDSDGTARMVSTGDNGVIDAYDNRPAQMFTNRRAAEFFYTHFGDTHPNFLMRRENNQVYPGRLPYDFWEDDFGYDEDEFC